METGALSRRRAPLLLKLELVQHSGSFKARGAHLHLLAPDLPAAGVVAASGGNFGAAVAYAARRLGVPATVFIPDSSAPTKLDRLRALDQVAYIRFASVYRAFADISSFEDELRKLIKS